MKTPKPTMLTVSQYFLTYSVASILETSTSQNNTETEESGRIIVFLFSLFFSGVQK